ncbi:hypothetical protein LIER_14697 [Lithospermum erythrorhizon]|uniref:Uncharacterized protein n=1 Tax=Lithospermum erythrorhizon TaxID=34254 RepID=A0AAV3Q2M3_LITER
MLLTSGANCRVSFKAMEVIATPIAVLLVDASETLQKLSLLRVSLEGQASRKQYEVQKMEKLEKEVAELETLDTSDQIDVLEKEIQVEQASHQGRLLTDLEASRLALSGLL